MSEFSIAIIGAGGISRAHINAASASNGRITVAAVVDPSEPARQAAATAAGCVSFSSTEELFASDLSHKLNGLIVCTPPSSRIPIVEAALKRGLAVMTEKPLASNLADARRLADLAEQYPKIVTAVGYCHRFTPAIVEMRNRIKSGSLGTITRFKNTFASHLPKLQQHWMSDPAISGGGACIDTGCHSLDMFLYLIGLPEVRSAVFTHMWPGRGETGATLLLDSNGVAGVINSAWLEPPRFTVTVVGTRGLLHYNYGARELVSRGPDGPEQHDMMDAHELRFTRQLAAFADAAMGQFPEQRPATFFEALETAKAVDAAIRIAAA